MCDQAETQKQRKSQNSKTAHAGENQSHSKSTVASSRHLMSGGHSRPLLSGRSLSWMDAKCEVFCEAGVSVVSVHVPPSQQAVVEVKLW
jgi:hypothetical protein